MKNQLYKLMFSLIIIWSSVSSIDSKAKVPQKQDKETAYTISDGSQFIPKGSYPKFSWDVTPTYFMFGESKRVLQPEEVNFIAERTGFICIEKSHGLNTLGAAELGTKHEAAAFKKAKPGIKVLFYFNSAYAWPFTSYNKNFTPAQIDKHPELKKFLIIDPETGKLANRRDVFFFDVLNPEFRKWWVETVAKGVEVSGCDGAFIDQMHGFAWLRKDKSAEVEKAQGEMMASLKKKLGSDKLLLGNNAADVKAVFPVVDAVMFEHYNEKIAGKENLLKEWNDMLKIAKAGKISVFRFGVEIEGNQPENVSQEKRNDEMAKLSKERVEFYLACYLIGAQPYSYFQYGWGWGLLTGPLVDYPEFSKPLGTPIAPYKRVTSDGWEFTREFEYASVWVDTEKREAKITWR